jgi:glucosyl-3-phosphoglycerate synthase
MLGPTTLSRASVVVRDGSVPHHSAYHVDDLLQLKAGRRISVCIPARDEESTVGRIVGVVRDELVLRHGLVDEIVVVDHDSHDGTGRVAAAAGATVHSADELLADFGAALGKGDVLWRSVHAASGDVIVWLDADLQGFGAHFVTGLLGPLLTDPEIALVRATYERNLGGVAGEGGRVTELLARPVIGMLFPELAHIRQPLGGEYAIRRDVAEAMSFEPDYGVEMGLLLDVAGAYGVGSIAQVDLGERVHRNRPLTALREQSRQVLRAVLSRTPGAASVRGATPLRPPLTQVFPSCVDGPVDLAG